VLRDMRVVSWIVLVLIAIATAVGVVCVTAHAAEASTISVVGGLGVMAAAPNVFWLMARRATSVALLGEDAPR
jgi:hypothetical protein